MGNTFRYFIFLLFFCIGSFALCGSSKAVSIFPLRQTLVIDPGKVAFAPVEVYNEENFPVEIVPEIDAFRLNPDTGHAEFGQADEAKSWVKANISSFVLAPKEKRRIEFTVSVPSTASRESHYLSLFVKQKSSAGQIGIGKRVGTLLFLHVSGDANEKLQLQDFSIEKNGGKIFAHIQLNNAGNIHVIPSGTIDLWNLWGKKVASIDINKEQRMLLPGGDWRSQVELKNISPINMGRLRVELHLNYGLTLQRIDQKISFWYFPWVAIFSGLFVIIGVLCTVLFVQKNKKV